ncbi:hypothetical protein [Hymenobacter properus]|uniref:Uncharacterized protein n=1 Tax=Hymenobacter properus TaxID=2791026 RepID=A0A931BN74_9BACT|nr:hypothetical protein [Hymenobacter properus]MBF9143373.1 hypothetical protein [Hymenobacter properus]MBR7722184.1 hypothetical protein [Microvirga sp. SRT04]
MKFDNEGFAKWLRINKRNSTYPETLVGMRDLYQFNLDTMSPEEYGAAVAKVAIDNESILDKTSLSKKDFSQIYKSRTPALRDYQRYLIWVAESALNK